MSARLWRIVLLVFALIGIASAQTGSEPLQQAETAYTSGDYRQAITLYEAAIVNGARDSRIYFNLGNAYYLDGDLGRALLNYRRAHHLNPRDTEINYNLNRVRGQRTDIQSDETAIIDTIAAITSGTLTQFELGWLTLMVWSIGFGLLAAYIQRPQWRNAMRVPLVMMTALILLTMSLFISRLYVESNRPAAVIVDPSVRVRSGPGEQYLEHFQIHAAAEIRILETRDGWLHFTLPDGREGWIPQTSAEGI